MALTQISTAGVKDDAVTSGKIPANAVGSSELADNAVDTAAIATGAVTSAKLGASAVGETKLATDAVTTAKIAGGAVTEPKLAANSINTAKIEDQAVTLAKLEHGTSSNNGKFLRANNGADPTFETVNTDLVSDTSPQLGGDLDTNGNEILLDDDKHIKFGASEDLQIYHEGGGGDNIIKNNVANKHLKIQHKISDGSTVPAATFFNNTSVQLFNAGSSKFETTSNGIKVIGEADAGGGASSGNIQMVHSDGRKNTIGNHFATNAYDSRVEIGISDASTSGGTNRVASFSYAGLSFGTDTASANRLDDYEEGTFTPTATFEISDDGNKAYQNQSGCYTKVGRLVHCNIVLVFSNRGTGSGRLRLNGLPFTIGDRLSGTILEASATVGYFAGLISSVSGIHPVGIDGTNYMVFYGILGQYGSTTGDFGYAHVGNSFSIRMSITYQV